VTALPPPLSDRAGRGWRSRARTVLGSPTAVVSIIVAALLVLAAYYVLANRLTPYTADTYLQTYVIQIAPQVAGRVIRVGASDNAPVEQGGVLFEIDPRPYQFEVDRLRAELAEAQQEVQTLQENQKTATDAVQDLTAQQKLAQQRFDELSKLGQSGNTTRFSIEDVTGRLDEAVDNLREAKAALRVAEVKLQSIVDGEHALIHSAKAELDTAQYQLAQTRVVAPSDGIITNLQLAVGAYAQIGVPVMTLVDTSEWRMVANFPQNALSRIAPGQPAELSLDMYPGKVFEGTVESVTWGVSSGQGLPTGKLPAVATPQNWMAPSQRFPVRLRFDAWPEDRPLRVGATGIATVYTGGGPLMTGLARFWMRLRSLLAYLY
jgi:multidrug resistance efflux pump